MDDLISRQAAIDAVMECYDNDELFEVYEWKLNELPTIQPEPHWIPVDLENNEPQLEEWVLVSSDGYVMQDCIVERGGKKIWYHGGNIQADDRYMPLPEPYKGGEYMRYCRIKGKFCVFATESGYCSFTACREVIT